MARFKDADWNLTRADNGGVGSWLQAEIAVLMDIRDELKEIKQTLKESNQSLAVLRCSNFIDIPRKLDRIRLNTTKAKRKAKGTK